MFLNGYYWFQIVQYWSKITQSMKMANIVQYCLGQIIWYSTIIEYFGQIYSFTKIFVDFFRENLFGYSFVIFLSCWIYSDIHLSNIYGNYRTAPATLGLLIISPLPTLVICFQEELPWKITYKCLIARTLCDTQNIHIFFLNVFRYTICYIFGRLYSGWICFFCWFLFQK